MASLCRALSDRHHVTVLAAEYDSARQHGTLTWRVHDGVMVAELVNNWRFDTFLETWRATSLQPAIDHVLRATSPHVVHVHNLLNLSFDLPALARAHHAAVVATLHDYTAVCASGGQRVHRAEEHVCHDIDAERCARCFSQSPWAAQMGAARLVRGSERGGTLVRTVARTLGTALPRQLAAASTRMAGRLAPRVSAGDIRARLEAARHVLAGLDLAVAPSAAIARDLARFGLPPERTVIADYGFEPQPRAPDRSRSPGPLRIGFVGTLVWHKGAHVLLEAVRALPHESYAVRIAGDPDVFPEYVADLRRRAAGLPVTFTGRFDHREVGAVFADLDILVVPSLWPENSPLVIHEAFLAGVPVVGARTGGIAGLIEDGVSGVLFDSTRPDTLTAALRRVVQEPHLLEAWRAGRPRVRSIAEDAAEWDARYQALAGHGGRAA